MPEPVGMAMENKAIHHGDTQATEATETSVSIAGVYGVLRWTRER
jgi:hypothetical protein